MNELIILNQSDCKKYITYYNHTHEVRVSKDTTKKI